MCAHHGAAGPRVGHRCSGQAAWHVFEVPPILFRWLPLGAILDEQVPCAMTEMTR